MATRNDKIVFLLRERIIKIINLLETEKEKNRILDAEKRQVKEKILVLQKEKEEITLKYNSLKLAKKLDASFDSTHDAKLKVNSIVREIDKCIALLNK